MNMEGQAVESGAAAPEINLLQRVTMVFMAPVKLGEYLRTRSPWFWTLTIVAVISALIFLALVPGDLLVAAVEQQMRGRTQGQEFDPESAMRLVRITGTVGAVVGAYIGVAVIAGVLYLAFNVMLSGESTFKQHMSGTAHVYWINLLGFVLLLPIWIAKEDMTVKLGFGLLLPDAPASFVGHFLNNITIFGLWSASALGAVESGLAGGRISVGKAVGTVLALYLLWGLISAGWATIFAGIGG